MKTADELTDEEFTAAAEEWTSPAAKEIEALRAENSEYRELLRELLVQLRENTGIPEDGNAPFHAHEVPGVWDDDNDELSGKPCAWCAVWARAVANGLVGSNAPHEGRPAALSPGVPLDAVVRGEKSALAGRQEKGKE